MLTDPLWDQFSALLPERPTYDPGHPLGCHRPRISDRIIFDKMLQLLRFGCSYQAIADTTCSATTIRNRRDEWIALGVFARLKQVALASYDRIVGLVLDQIAVDGSITKAPGGGEVAGRSPVDRGKQGLKRSGMTDGYGIPLGCVLAGANRHDSPLLASPLDRLYDLGPLPDDVTVRLDAGYDSDKNRVLLDERGLHGRIARKGEKAPIVHEITPIWGPLVGVDSEPSSVVGTPGCGPWGSSAPADCCHWVLSSVMVWVPMTLRSRSRSAAALPGATV